MTWISRRSGAIPNLEHTHGYRTRGANSDKRKNFAGLFCDKFAAKIALLTLIPQAEEPGRLDTDIWVSCGPKAGKWTSVEAFLMGRKYSRKLLGLVLALNLLLGCAQTISTIQEVSHPYEKPKYIGMSAESPEKWNSTDWTLYMNIQGGG